MKSVQTEPGQWRLTFSEAEALFIINVLARVGENYSEDISRMSPALRAYWQGTIAREDVVKKQDLKEAQELLSEARSELRSERLALVETWLREFELAEQRDPWEVDITTSERDDLVAMLNDRRMLISLELGVTEHDMEADLGQISSEARRTGIMEIDVLGHFILVMLGPQIHRP